MENTYVPMVLTHCRTCMGTTNVTFIYDDIPQIAELSSVANLLVHIVPQLRIQENDGLPNHICQSCLNKLLEIYEFQQKCLSTEQKWLERLRKSRSTNTIPAFSKTLEITQIDGYCPKDPLNNNDGLYNTVDFHKKEELNNLNDRVYGINKFSTIPSDATVKMETTNALINQRENETFKQSDHKDTNDNNSFNIARSNENINSNLNESSNRKKRNKLACPICGKFLSASGVLNRHVKQVHRTVNGGAHTSHISNDNNGAMKLNLSNSVINMNWDTTLEQSVPNNGASSINSNIRNANEQTQRKIKKKPKLCNICGKNLSSSGVLNRHTKQVHGIIKENKCQGANDPENIVQNVRGLKKRIKRPHLCKYCNKGFSIPTRLRDHERVHTGERPHLCSQCGLGFKTASNLIQHLYRHKGDKRYECPHCPKRFICLADLGSHKAVHNKDRPYSCDICGSSFAKSYLLRRHKMYHSNDKPHKCDYCDMRFVMACQMRSHRRIHTGEKPYKCKYCPRVFARSTHAARHLRSHLGTNIHGCELCPQRFRLRSELRAHFVSHKNEDNETRSKNLEALKQEQEKLYVRFNLPTSKVNE